MSFYSLRKWIYLNYRHRPIRTHLACILHELCILVLDRMGRLKARRWRKATGLKLNLGCGPNAREGWVNIDIEGPCDVTLDLRRRLPFAKGGCDIVYSEHVLEHLDYPQPALRLLRSARRALKPGGIIHVGVPDAGAALEKYGSEGGPEKVARDGSEFWHPGWCKTGMDYINLLFRLETRHKFAYDEETLTKLLRRAGFSGIRRRDFDPALDSEDRRRGTLYMCAVKGESSAGENEDEAGVPAAAVSTGGEP